MLLAFTDGAALRPSGPPATGLQVWLKSDAGVATSGSNVTSWTDQASGIVFTTAAGTPTLLSGGAGINGLPAIRFNNLGGSLQSCYLSATYNPTPWAGMTILYVARTAASGSIPIYASVFSWNQAGIAFYNFSTGSDTFSQGLGWNRFNSGGSPGDFSPPLTNGEVVIEAATYDKANWVFSGRQAGGNSDTSWPTNVVSAQIGSSFTYGGSQNTGDIAEILAYDHKLSDADLAAAMSYANGRYK